MVGNDFLIVQFKRSMLQSQLFSQLRGATSMQICHRYRNENPTSHHITSHHMNGRRTEPYLLDATVAVGCNYGGGTKIAQQRPPKIDRRP